MNTRASLTLAIMPAVLVGLVLFFLETVAVSGEGLNNRAFSAPGAPLLQGSNETEPNNTIDTADPIAVNLTIVGQIPFTPTGDIDFFRLVIPTADVGRDFRVTLQELPSSGDYQLKLSLFDAEGDFLDSDNTTGGDTLLDWSSAVITYYFSIEGVTIDKAATYEITVIRFDAPPATATPVPWDACEINDDINGTWSPDTPPGGPCELPVGLDKEDLNFVPYSGQPAPNDDYFVFLAKAGRVYRVTTQVAGGADTEMWLFDPSGAQIAYDDDGGEGSGSRIEMTLSDSFYKVLVRDRLGSSSPSTSQIYSILVEDVTPATRTPTSTPLPGTGTPTSRPPSIPGNPDAFEPNYDFNRATLIGLDTKYTNLNFVPWTGVDQDNDFFKLWVIAGKLFACETSALGTATNTNMIICSGPSWEQCFAGNDDVVPFDPADPYRSRLTFFSSYSGYLYLILGQVGAERILPGEWANLTYSLQCFIDQPGTATPTPTSAVAPPPPPTSTPQPTPIANASLPVPSPTPAQLVVLPMTTPTRPAPSVPVATPTPVLTTIELLLYYDRNKNAQADPGEGIMDVLARTYDAFTGDLLSIDYTDEVGYLQFTVPGRGPVRVSVPFFGFDQVVTATRTSIQIRVSPPQ